MDITLTHTNDHHNAIDQIQNEYREIAVELCFLFENEKVAIIELKGMIQEELIDN